MALERTELQRNALADARRKELDFFQRTLDIQWLNSRMEDGRMGRCLALIQREAEMEKDYQERTDHAAIVNARAEKEIALGVEIAKARDEEACNLLRRHYLRERDPSLRELTRKLQAGYTCRDLKQQIQSNEYRRLQEKAEENHINAVLRNSLYNDNEQMAADERASFEAKQKYRQELQQQLVNMQKQKQCQYEDTLIEKKMLDDIMRTISDEDEKELREKREQVEKLRKEMLTFQQARNAWKEKQKQLVILEEKQIEEQNKKMSDRSSAIIAERERRLKEKDEINTKVAAQVMAEQEERQNREDIIKALQEQEYLEKNVQDAIAEKEKLERSKNDTKAALTAQMQMRRRAEEEQRKREAAYRRENEIKLAEENAKEVEKQRKLREKNRAYSLELLRAIEEKERAKQREREDNAARAGAVFQAVRDWEQEVKQEREKIIEEHVPSLLGCLQIGVITREDLPTVRRGANKDPELAKLDIEGMAHTKRPHRFSKCNAQCRILRTF